MSARALTQITVPAQGAVQLVARATAVCGVDAVCVPLSAAAHGEEAASTENQQP